MPAETDLPQSRDRPPTTERLEQKRPYRKRERLACAIARQAHSVGEAELALREPLAERLRQVWGDQRDARAEQNHRTEHRAEGPAERVICAS